MKPEIVFIWKKQEFYSTDVLEIQTPINGWVIFCHLSNSFAAERSVRMVETHGRSEGYADGNFRIVRDNEVIYTNLGKEE